MGTEEVDDLVSQAPPAKRVRLDNEFAKSGPSTPIDDMDDIYDNESKPAMPISVSKAHVQSLSPVETVAPAFSGIPGLGRLGSAPRAMEQTAEAPVLPIPAEETKEVSATEFPDAEMPDSEQMTALATEKTTKVPVQPIPVEELKEVPTAEEHNVEMSGMEERLAAATKPHSANSPGDLPASHGGHIFPTSETQTPTDEESIPLTHALEALLGGLDSPTPKAPDVEIPPIAEEPAADEHPEWEVDSSPIESSDDSSSDDSSSEEDSEDEENAYKLLSPEEQARILMEGDGGSDDEGGATKAKGAGGQLRTKNEIPEEVIPKPNVTITTEERIEELGVVETIVESIILIKAKTSGEYRALESGSVLCLEDRSAIGVVSETLGRVQQPLYTVRFTNAGEITEAGVSIGTKVFYPEQHANYALTQVLRNYKGSDASNLHDEEVGDEEVEFSDDEAEAEHKRRLKQKKLERRGGKMHQNGGGRGGHGHPLRQEHAPLNGTGGLSYDDAEDDGPYKPLARPTGFADTVGRSEALQEDPYVPGGFNRGGRGDFRGRGRGDRGRGRGDRGRSRGGFQDRRESNGYSAPPQRPNNSYRSEQSPPSHQGAGFPQSPVVPPNPNNFFGAQQGQFHAQQPQLWPQFPQMPQVPGYPNMPNWPNIPNMPNMPQPPTLPAGAFINPAFFAGHQSGAQNQWNQQQGPQGGRGRDGSSS